jgi:lipoprotein-anchoring transpeptidase ErfK/SrfK
VLMVYDGGRLVFATLISSGSHPFYTQPGVFQVYKMLVNDRMSGSFEADKADYYYLEDVPYILYYDQLRAIHGAYWNTYLGNPGSHGCVNMSVADAHWIYDWAKEGDFVYVWDPTGKTPTDPSFYGAGGF